INITASYNNLIGNAAGVKGIATGDGHGNQVGVPNAVTYLGPLQNNGGLLVGAPGSTTPLLTIALLPGSSAFNAGNNSQVPASLTFDERGPGFSRIAGGTVDIGAFEVQSAVLAITSAASTTFAAGSASSFTVIASSMPIPTLTESGTLPVGITFTDL